MSWFSIETASASLGVVASLVVYLYQRRKYAKSIMRQLELESFSTYVLRGLGYRLARYLRPRAAARLSLRAFAVNRLAASPATVHVPAAVPVELPIDKMFVPLTAISRDQDRMSASQIASGKYRRVLLVGDPGSGKSTLVRRIYRDICSRTIMAGFAGRLPVLLELKNIDQYSRSNVGNDGMTLVQLVKDQVTSVRTYSGDDLYESFLNDGRLTIMLDGLDEIKTSDFDVVTRAIVELCDHLGRQNERNQVIVTTRRQLYVNLPESFSSVFEAHLTLEPFTADDMYEFLRKWPYQGESEIEIARIFGNLASQPNIRSMCQTPLILAMYVATDQLTGGEGLPETRPDFYKAVTDELLVRRRGRQLGLTTGLNLLRRNRQQLLGRLALEHLLDEKQSRNTLRWDAAVNIVREQEGLSEGEAGQRLRELSRDTGLFTEERREESLRFIHLTFCEFLAAQAIVQGATYAWDMIAKSVEEGFSRSASSKHSERFSEVIVFAAALEENEQVRRERIRWVLKSCGTDIALRAIRDSQPYDDEYVLHELGRMTIAISETRPQYRDENWLHLFRQIAAVLRDRELVESAITSRMVDLLAPFFARTVDESSADFSRLFLSYLRLDPAGALELARSMERETGVENPQLLAGALDEPAVLAHALARLASDLDGAKTWASVLATGALYYRSVANRLLSMTAKKELVQRVDHGGRRGGWQRCWVTRGTALGTVLEAGCRWPESSSLMSLLASVSVPANRWTERLRSITVGSYLRMFFFLSSLAFLSQELFSFPAAWLVIGVLVTGLTSLIVESMSKWHMFPTMELLRSSWLPRDSEEYNVRVARVSAALGSSTIPTLEALRIIRSLPLPAEARLSRLQRQRRRLPVLLSWSPNLRLFVLTYVMPFLLSKEVGDPSEP